MATERKRQHEKKCCLFTSPPFENILAWGNARGRMWHATEEDYVCTPGTQCKYPRVTIFIEWGERPDYVIEPIGPCFLVVNGTAYNCGNAPFAPRRFPCPNP